MHGYIACATHWDIACIMIATRTLKYRQHESNVSGGQMSYMQKIAKIKKNRGAKYNVAQSIKTCCWHDMPEQNRIILQAFLGYKCSFYGKLRS